MARAKALLLVCTIWCYFGIALSQEQTTDNGEGIQSLIIGQAMMYRVQQLACAGVTYRFTCDRPNYIIKVGRGMNWGVMANQTTPLQGEQCKYSVGDCYIHDAENPFLNSLYERCEETNTCTFLVPSVPVPECDNRLSHYAFILLSCAVGDAEDEVSPITNPPSGIVNITPLSTNQPTTSPANSNPFNTPPLPPDSGGSSTTTLVPPGGGSGGQSGQVGGSTTAQGAGQVSTTEGTGAGPDTGGDGGQGETGGGAGGPGDGTGDQSGGTGTTPDGGSSGGDGGGTGGGNGGSPDGRNGGQGGNSGGEGEGVSPGNLFGSTQVMTGPQRDPRNDTVLYKVQAAYCSGSTYTFSCDKPDHVMWVGQGLIWGTKHNSAPDNETCMPREGDCQHAELDNQLLDLLVKRCNYRHSCWFEVPEVMIPGCERLSDWVFLLFKCGMTFNWRPPPISTPPGILSTIPTRVPPTTKSLTTIQQTTKLPPTTTPLTTITSTAPTARLQTTAVTTTMKTTQAVTTQPAVSLTTEQTAAPATPVETNAPPLVTVTSRQEPTSSNPEQQVTTKEGTGGNADRSSPTPFSKATAANLVGGETTKVAMNTTVQGPPTTQSTPEPVTSLITGENGGQTLVTTLSTNQSTVSSTENNQSESSSSSESSVTPVTSRQTVTDLNPISQQTTSPPVTPTATASSVTTINNDSAGSSTTTATPTSTTSRTTLSSNVRTGGMETSNQSETKAPSIGNQTSESTDAQDTSALTTAVQTDATTGDTTLSSLSTMETTDITTTDGPATSINEAPITTSTTSKTEKSTAITGKTTVNPTTGVTTINQGTPETTKTTVTSGGNLAIITTTNDNNGAATANSLNSTVSTTTQSSGGDGQSSSTVSGISNASSTEAKSPTQTALTLPVNTTGVPAQQGETEKQVLERLPLWVWIVVGIGAFLFILVIILVVIICYWNDYKKQRKRKDKYNRPKAERHFDEGSVSASGAAALGTYDSIDIEGEDTDSVGTAGSAAGSTGEILRR